MAKWLARATGRTSIILREVLEPNVQEPGSYRWKDGKVFAANRTKRNGGLHEPAHHPLGISGCLALVMRRLGLILA